MRLHRFTLAAATCTALVPATMATAGGYVAPVIEIVTAAPSGAAPTAAAGLCARQPQVCVTAAALLALLAVLLQKDKASHAPISHPSIPDRDPVVPPIAPPDCGALPGVLCPVPPGKPDLPRSWSPKPRCRPACCFSAVPWPRSARPR